MAEKLNDYDTLTAYKRVLKLDPGNVFWHVKVARLYMKNGSINAERYLKRALKISPNHRHALQLMVEYHKNYAIAAHAKIYQKRLDAFSLSAQRVKPLVLSSQQPIKASNQTVATHEEWVQNEEPVIDQQQKLIDQYMKSARKSMQNNEWMKAEVYLSKVIKHNFKHVTARYLMAKAAEERGELRLAKKRYKMVIFIDKKHLLALTAWGRVSEKLNSADALAAYQGAMRIEPENVLWHLKVAQYYMKHKPLRAKRYLNNVLRIDPNNRQALQLMITYHQKHMLIAHAETYQRRLRELTPITPSPEQLTQAVLRHEKHVEPSVVAVQQDMDQKNIDLSSLHSMSKLWVQKLTTSAVAIQMADPVKAENEVSTKETSEEQNRLPSDVNVFQYYVLAVKEGRAHDQLMLGLMYYEGRGVAKDTLQAIALLRQAAKQGLHKAQLSLGLILYETRSNKYKEMAAVKWLKKAANQGLAEAQYAVGLIYATNPDYKNEIKAVKWWKAAALQGHAQAQHNLGVMYFNGQGVAKNRKEAMRWFRQAAEYDQADITLNVDKLYSEGENNNVKTGTN